jgi:hypothetical protein
MQWSVVTWRGASLIRSLPYTLACTAKSASGTAGGFIGRQPRHIRKEKTSQSRLKAASPVFLFV